MRVALMRILGWVVIAHGLAQAVLPLRGLTVSAALMGDWVPVGLYIISMVGFVAAGLGLLGLRPFEYAISPLLVLASGLSLVAIVQLGHGDLWVGGALDAALLLVGVWSAVAGWPAALRTHARVWHVLAVTCASLFLAYVTAATMLWPWHRTWGSTDAELEMALPGDQVERHRAFEIQHAVTIDVTPDHVWPWLVQLGQDRAGSYSVGWLERAIGADVRNRRVAEIQPGRAMVLQNRGAFVLMPTDDGRTRFIIRTTIGSATIPVWAAALEFMTFELPHFIMERRMMLGIKALAERQSGTVARSR